MDSGKTATIITIGKEILSAKRTDSNSSWLASQLHDLGINVKEIRVVGDSEPEIKQAVVDASQKSDYVFTTGGLGTTHDDLTAEAVAAAFDKKIIIDPKAEKILREFYRDDINPDRMLMARVPEGGELIENPVTAAPGFKSENVFVFAGIPQVMHAMFASVKHQFSNCEPLLSNIIQSDADLPSMNKEIAELKDQFPGVQIFAVELKRTHAQGSRIIIRHQNAEIVQAASNSIENIIKEKLGKRVVEPGSSDKLVIMEAKQPAAEKFDSHNPRAGLIIVDNEDKITAGGNNDNLKYMARELRVLGIDLSAVRIVKDSQAEIDQVKQEFERKYKYVLGVGTLGKFETTSLNLAGQNGGVISMSDREDFLETMFERMKPYLKGGVPLLSCEIQTDALEGEYGHQLKEIARKFAGVDIGSYPKSASKPSRITIDSPSEEDIATVREEVEKLISRLDKKCLKITIDNPNDKSPVI